MRIIHVAQFLGVGGLEKILFHLALEQQAAGHEVCVYVYDYERSWIPYFEKNGIHVITPPLKKNGYDIKLLLRMYRDFKQADIIHTHDLNPLMYLSPLSLILKFLRKKNFRLIHTTHGIDHIRASKKSKIYEQIATLNVDKVVAVSSKIEEFYKKDLYLLHSKTKLITNGIKTYKHKVSDKIKEEKKRWLCEKHQLDFNRPIVLSLSRVAPLKDQKFLIRCFKQRPQYQLIIAGPAGDETYYQELKKEEDKNIKLIGAQEMVEDYNLGADLYVSASTSEGLPVAVLEAMAVETPCLVSGIPGHQILNNHGGFVDLFQLGDLTSFLDKCDFLLSNKETTGINSKKSRETVENFFSVDNMVKNYFEIYQA